MPTDVHQHLWTRQFVEAMRDRRQPPALDRWTLRLDGVPDYDVDPVDHDVAARRDLAAADGVDLVLVSLSSPLGIEWLPPDEAAFLALGRSSYAVIRALGVDVIVNGSGRPYTAPADVGTGGALAHAVRTTNPHRLLDSKGGHHALGILAGQGPVQRSTSRSRR